MSQANTFDKITLLNDLGLAKMCFGEGTQWLDQKRCCGFYQHLETSVSVVTAHTGQKLFRSSQLECICYPLHRIKTARTFFSESWTT